MLGRLTGNLCIWSFLFCSNTAVQYYVIVTKAIREIIRENVSSLGFLRKLVRVIVRLRIYDEKEKTTDRHGTHEQSDDTWRTAIVRGNSDGGTDDFPVSRRRSQQYSSPRCQRRARAQLPDLPATAHASPRYDVHAEPVVVVVVTDVSETRPKPPMFFFISISITLHRGLAGLGTEYRRKYKFKRLNYILLNVRTISGFNRSRVVK